MQNFSKASKDLDAMNVGRCSVKAQSHRMNLSESQALFAEQDT